MNSIALPASASSSAFDAEADLVRQAASGSKDAFEELYRRHSETTWRLAQAVAADRDRAVAAVADGFVQALRNHRRLRRQSADAGFRPLVLSAVYRSIMDRPHDHAAPTPTVVGTAGRRRNKATADAALVQAAFRSLPERWRAAVWLSEVENMDLDRIASVLGVSVAVAAQLVSRGAKGLAGRFTQARSEAPEHIGSVLRSVALATPAGLAIAVEDRWASASSDPGARFAPISEWLEERAVRPLWVAVCAVAALGVIALPIVNQGASTTSKVGSSPTSIPSGTAPRLNGNGNSSAAGPVLTSPTAAAGATAATTAAGVAGTAATTPAATTTPASSGGGSQAVTSPSTGTTPGGSGTTTPTNPSSPGTTTTTPAPKTVVSLAPVATVTQTSSGYQVNLITTSSGPVASVSTCSSGVGLDVAGIDLPCSSTSSPGSTSTTSTVVNTATDAVAGITSKL